MTTRSGFPSPARPPRAAPGLAVLFAAVCAGCGDATLDLFDPDRGLLAHWALDEAQAGSVAVDSSGFALHATPSTNPPIPSTDVPPVNFQDTASLSLNGEDQWLEVGNPPLLNAGGKISIAAWIRPTSIDGYHVVLAHGFRNSPYFELSLRIKDGRYEFTYWNTVDHEGAADIPASDVGAWVHLCGVFDGGQYLLYRNGVQAAATADATTPPANVDTPWAIGARIAPPDAPSRLFQGGMDDVRVYGRALSAAEVGALARR